MIRYALPILVLGACAKKHEPGTTVTAPASTSSSPSTSSTGSSAPAGKPMTTCPAIQMRGPDSVSQTQKATVVANLIDADGTPTFRWTVSAGTIASGQGTSVIQVDPRGLSGQSVTATVELGGLPKTCESTAGSTTFLVGP